MTLEKIEFTYPDYVADLKKLTYPNVAMVAITRGTMSGVWEELIGEMLLMDVGQKSYEAVKTLENLGVDANEKAATIGGLILNNDKLNLY